MSTPLAFDKIDKGPLCAWLGCEQQWRVAVTTGAKQQRVCFAHMRAAMQVPAPIPREVTP
jgi:hypothetical protein